MRILLVLTLLLVSTSIWAPRYYSAQKVEELKKSHRMDPELMTMIDQMSIDEKIGQLMMIRAHSDKGQEHIDFVKKQITKYKIGGLCFFQGNPHKQAELTNEYQEIAEIPLLISMDAEWGLGMRLKGDVISYPRQLMLGAIRDSMLLYDFGVQVGAELRRIGVHMNFAPVADVNNNPNNPVINDRSFGEDKEKVLTRTMLYARGMEDNGVLAVGKHFPGHGDTDVDSHHDLPIITKTFEDLSATELYPFRGLIQSDISGLMIAHLHVPAIDPTPNLPTSLSPKAIRDLLRTTYQYDGLVITDGMEMKGVTKHFGSEEACIKAFLAGNDIILLPEDIEKVIPAFKKSVAEGLIPKKQLDQSVHRILRAKKHLGILHTVDKISPKSISSHLRSARGLRLRKKLIAESITLVRGIEQRFPLDPMETFVLSISPEGDIFSQHSKNNGAAVRTVSQAQLSSQTNELLRLASRSENIVVAMHMESRYSSKNFGLKKATLDFLYTLNHQVDNVILLVFGNPYSLHHFDDFEQVICAYDDEAETNKVAHEAIFQNGYMNGALPVTVSDRTIAGSGLKTRCDAVLTPMGEDVGKHLDSDSIRKIENLITQMIEEKAAPGCQLLIAQNGRVLHNKGYGYFTYDSVRVVSSDDLYDLASISKVAATTLAIMKLVDEGLLDLDTPMEHYLPLLTGSNKAGMTLRQVLSHHAQLRPWIPFYRETLEGDKQLAPSPFFYRTMPDSGFRTPVSDNLFVVDSYKDSMIAKIIETDLRENREYKYSDLGFILARRIIESISGTSLDELVDSIFYTPLGLDKMTYNPLKIHSKDQIAPTEIDTYFRFDTIQGYVHDMAAALEGGVGGHAGLFSNAQDLAVIFQMLLNKGVYGGKRYLSPELIDEFTTRYALGQRRGLGFDMKDLEAKNEEECNTAMECSELAFGHYGFTGTAVWADPRNDLIYILLSNRTYPTMESKKFSQESYRSRIQSMIYRAILD